MNTCIACLKHSDKGSSLIAYHRCNICHGSTLVAWEGCKHFKVGLSIQKVSQSTTEGNNTNENMETQIMLSSRGFIWSKDPVIGKDSSPVGVWVFSDWRRIVSGFTYKKACQMKWVNNVTMMHKKDIKAMYDWLQFNFLHFDSKLL